MADDEAPSRGSELQEYFGLLHDAASASDPQTRDVRLLRAWGVLRYIFYGPIKCEQCQTQVQLAIPIVSERLDGKLEQFECLCTNCTFKELGIATRIVMQVGGARVEYLHEDCIEATGK